MAAAARAGVLSAAVCLSPGCGSDGPAAGDSDEPLRRAAFRSLAARDFLLTCPAAAGRRDVAYHSGRYDELKRLAVGKGAGRAIWLGENDWAGVSRFDEREPCEPGVESYRQAVAAYSGALDAMVGRIAEYRP
jgi:hypothetical protein